MVLNVGFPYLPQVEDKAREFWIGGDFHDVFQDDNGLVWTIDMNLALFGIDQPS